MANTVYYHTILTMLLKHYKCLCNTKFPNALNCAVTTHSFTFRKSLWSQVVVLVLTESKWYVGDLRWLWPVCAHT